MKRKAGSKRVTVSMVPPEQNGGVMAWFKNQLWNTSLPWLLMACIGGVLFYADTTRTQKTHSDTLTKLETTIAETKKENVDERTRMRETFLVDSKATALGMAKLNEQTAVMTTVLQSMNRSLEKLEAKLESLQSRK